MSTPHRAPQRPTACGASDAVGDGIAHAHKDDWDRRRLPLESNRRQGTICQDDVRLQADQLLREGWYPIDVTDEVIE
jgi:hypothetical protein